jgi:hypothetical protein
VEEAEAWGRKSFPQSLGLSFRERLGILGKSTTRIDLGLGEGIARKQEGAMPSPGTRWQYPEIDGRYRA